MWHALILALILCPEEPQLPSKASPEAWQALKDIAVVMEVVGPHENWATDFASELRYVRRYWRLLREAPPLSDCHWLPPPSLSREMCCFNETHQAHLQMQRLIYVHRCNQLTEMIAETRQLYQVWECVRRANSPNESWALRRRMLQRLRDSIGEEAYYANKLPSWVPWWHFQQVP